MQSLTEYFDQPLEERLKDIHNDASNCRRTFERNLILSCMLHYERCESYDKGLHQKLENYYQQGLLYFDINYEDIVVAFVFLQEELDVIHNYKNVHKKNHSNVTLYEDFLNENRDRYWQIDRLTKDIIREGSVSFDKYAKPKIGEADMNIYEMNHKLSSLFWLTKRILLIRLIKFKEKEPLSQNDLDQMAQRFDFELYKDPVIYTEFPAEKLRYLKTLKSWLLQEIEKYKRTMEWSELPMVFQVLQDYANELVITTKKSSTQSTSQPVNERKEKQLDEIDYPKYIFKDFQAYQLFHELAMELKSHTSLSFLYRKMSEYENPPLIVVRDAPFREWFNKQKYDFRLSVATRTHQSTSNPERELLYKTAKKLIYQQES